MLVGVVYYVYGLRLPPGWIIPCARLGAGLAVARVATDGFLADQVPQGLQGHIHALFSAVATAGSLLRATVSGFIYAVEPGVPLLTMGVLYCWLRWHCWWYQYCDIAAVPSVSDMAEWGNPIRARRSKVGSAPKGISWASQGTSP